MANLQEALATSSLKAETANKFIDGGKHLQYNGKLLKVLELLPAQGKVRAVEELSDEDLYHLIDLAELA